MAQPWLGAHNNLCLIQARKLQGPLLNFLEEELLYCMCQENSRGLAAINVLKGLGHEHDFKKFDKNVQFGLKLETLKGFKFFRGSFDLQVYKNIEIPCV